MRRMILASLILLVALLGGLQGVDARPLNDPNNYLYDVARGNLPGARVISGYGEVSIGGSENNIDVWIADGTQPEPVPAGYQPTIVSSSIEDDIEKEDTDPGTGIHALLVHYLDTAGIEREEAVTMNGQAAVTMVADDVQFINQIHATAVGSGTLSAGNIDAKNGGTVVSRIGVSGNFSLSTMRQVPMDKRLYITGWHASAVSGAGGKSATVRLRSSSNDPDLMVGVYLFKDVVIVKETSTGWLLFDPPLLVPSGATVKVSVWTTGAMDVNAHWRGWLEPN